MSAKGIWLSEEAVVVPILPSSSAVSGTVESDFFTMKNAAHASILVMSAVTGSAVTVQVLEATGHGGTSGTAIAFDYAEQSTASSDIYLAVAAATSGGLSTSARDNMSWIIEIDASKLSDGYPFVGIRLSSAASTVISAYAILTGIRYAEDINLTALT